MPVEVDAFLCTLSRASEPIQAAVSKLGGVPVFLRETNWPTCEHCGSDMDFLGQISLKSPVRSTSLYEMAYLFMCPGKFDKRGWLECETWDPNAGANAVLLQRDSGGLIVPRRTPTYPDYVLTFRPPQSPQPAWAASTRSTGKQFRRQASN